jgi:hypothetical protein
MTRTEDISTSKLSQIIQPSNALPAKDEDFSLVRETSFATICMYIKQSLQGMWRSPIGTCLSFFTITIVVWATLIVGSIVTKGNIIFLKQAENKNGNWDYSMWINSYNRDSNYVWYQDYFNYRQFDNVYNPNGDLQWAYRI